MYDTLTIMTSGGHDYSFWDMVSEDAARVGCTINPHSPIISRLLQARRTINLKSGFACVFWLRVNQLWVHKGWRGQLRIRMWRQYRFANDISPYADIGPGLLLPHPVDVTIGASVKIGRGATIRNGVSIEGGEKNGLPRLGDNVTVNTGAKIINSSQIGDNSVVGALTLCYEDVPPNSIVCSVPKNITIPK